MGALSFRVLPDQPTLDGSDDVVQLLVGQLPPGTYAVPFRKAGSIACGRCMLGDEHGMAAVWGLLPVVDRLGRRKALGDEAARMRENRLQALRPEIFPFPWPQSDAV